MTFLDSERQRNWGVGNGGQKKVEFLSTRPAWPGLRLCAAVRGPGPGAPLEAKAGPHRAGSFGVLTLIRDQYWF